MKYLSAFGLCMLMMCAAPALLAQNHAPSYAVVHDAGMEDLAPYHSVLQSTNLDSYRKLDERRVLNFENGIKVELLSVNELEAMGIPVDAAVRQIAAEPKREAIFSVRGGILVEQVRPVGKQGR